jgi:hypothetical protein
MKTYKAPTIRPASEEAELLTFFNQLRLKHPALGAVAVHIPNEGKRQRGATRDKARGLVTGAADVLIPGCPALVIELKRTDGGRLSKAQRDYLEAAERLGAVACVCHGWEAAMEAVENWLLSLDKP